MIFLNISLIIRVTFYNFLKFSPTIHVVFFVIVCLNYSAEATPAFRQTIRRKRRLTLTLAVSYWEMYNPW